MSNPNDMLKLEELGPGKYRVHQPEEQAEGRDVVFGGQLLAQTLMAADKANGGTKDIKSIHSIFARAGTYTQPIDLLVETMQSGRTWASHSISAVQNDRLLCRSLVLSSIDDPDLMRHGLRMPAATPPGLKPLRVLSFKGAVTTEAGSAERSDGVPRNQYWHRYDGKFDSLAAHQAILAWATNSEPLVLAMRAHPESVSISQAHRTLSTGVIGHTINFHERFDIASWLLVCQEATYAGRGRTHARGDVFTEDGRLVATFSQDGMARRVDEKLDPKRSL